MQKINHYTIRGVIELKSGTRIGGSDDVLQIGGTDLTCIKDPVSGRPYLPGSSLKGRMRSALERHWGLSDGRGPSRDASERNPVARVFGPHMNPNHRLGPTRLIVKDAPVLGDFTLEMKTESSIRRDTGAAEHPRTLERVAPGAKFQLELGLQEFDADGRFEYPDADGTTVRGRDALLAVVYHCIDLLEDMGIGSGTGKGYGEVAITLETPTLKQRRRKVPPLPPSPGSGAPPSGGGRRRSAATASAAPDAERPGTPPADTAAGAEPGEAGGTATPDTGGATPAGGEPPATAAGEAGTTVGGETSPAAGEAGTTTGGETGSSGAPGASDTAAGTGA